MKRFVRTSLALGTMLMTGYAVPVFAQAAPPPADEAEHTDRGGIQEIVVVARKTEESLQTVPVAVSAYSGAMLEKQSIVNITQLQTTTPNLNFSSAVAQPGSATVFIRGQGSSDGLIAIDQAVGIYLDGVYSARSTGGAFDMVDVQRVEVLRGPPGTRSEEHTSELQSLMRISYDVSCFKTKILRSLIYTPFNKRIILF